MQFSLALLASLLIAGLVQALPTKRDAGSLWGITYTAKGSDGSCHSAEQVSESIKRFKDNGIMNIRTYSQECDQLPNILNAIQENGGDMKVLAAIWIGGDNDDSEVSNLEKALEGANKNLISGIAVGNEAVHAGLMDASSVASRIKEIKQKFGEYKVGTVETAAGFSSDMIDASDIVWVNIHPFFGGVSADEAVQNLQQQLSSFKGKASGKDIVIGEVGWPSEGDTNGDAKPGTDEMSTVVKALMNSDIKYYYFESHDSKWKGGGAYNIEPHWGIVDQNGKSKISEYQ
ncbi:glycoside hydrolase superfamily [Zychaea mexicana]|uniref:glycoside hydrolase superfamily n=1 Tax=Zychaea mexicana TaxID=64656 RepID=UPI0022FDE6D8|nr:glycoside hydrolase superfamily [Zychaea mexicana]KAI9499209.1 glycoside hydrolase superfamily [Zychaea mexicana]